MFRRKEAKPKGLGLMQGKPEPVAVAKGEVSLAPKALLRKIAEGCIAARKLRPRVSGQKSKHIQVPTTNKDIQ